MKRNKRGGYGSNRMKALTETGYACAYCGEAATQADHVVPYSWAVDNSFNNLVACCDVCNVIAGSKMFDSFYEKKEYILAERTGRKWSKRLEARRVIIRKREELSMPPVCVEEKPKRTKKEKRPVYRGEPGKKYGIKSSPLVLEPKKPEERKLPAWHEEYLYRLACVRNGIWLPEWSEGLLPKVTKATKRNG